MSEDDQLLLPINIIKEYLKNKNLELNINSYGTDIDTIINSIFFYMNSKQRPYQEFLDFKQDFINMMVFDLELLNTDRNLGNWFIRENKSTGEIDLYPMFDNEMILGFNSEIETNSGELIEKNVEEANFKRKSSIVTPTETRKGIREASYEDVIKYLLKKYNFQTQQALKQSTQFSYEQLEKILEEIGELKSSRKKRVLELFTIRTKSINKIYEEFNKDEKEKD